MSSLSQTVPFACPCHCASNSDRTLRAKARPVDASGLVRACPDFRSNSAICHSVFAHATSPFFAFSSKPSQIAGKAAAICCWTKREHCLEVTLRTGSSVAGNASIRRCSVIVSPVPASIVVVFLRFLPAAHTRFFFVCNLAAQKAREMPRHLPCHCVCVEKSQRFRRVLALLRIPSRRQIPCQLSTKQ